LGIAKGSVFQHFKSKDGLFFEAYKKSGAVVSKVYASSAVVLEQGFLNSFVTGWRELRTWCEITGPHTAFIWSEIMDRSGVTARDQTVFSSPKILTDGATS